MNLKLKAALVFRYGSQVDAALALGLPAPSISRLVRERDNPSDKTKKILSQVFGAEAVRAMFDKLDSNAPSPPHAA